MQHKQSVDYNINSQHVQVDSWEMIDNPDEDCFGSIPEVHSAGRVERDHGTDDEDVAGASIEDGEALGLLARLRSYSETREDGEVAVAWYLNRCL